MSKARIAMKVIIPFAAFFLIAAPYCIAQEPLTVLSSSWQKDSRKAPKNPEEFQARIRSVSDDNRFFKRKAREQLPVVAIDPNEASIDGRSASIDRAMQEARAPRIEPTNGYTYAATVRNNIGKTVKIVYWEYRFTELADRSNAVRRQFLCAVDIKDGEKKEMSIFSTLGPSDVIDTRSLEPMSDKKYDEKVLINRIELADGTILQRNDWKFQDVKKSVDRVTSEPWGHEMCRSI